MPLMPGDGENDQFLEGRKLDSARTTGFQVPATEPQEARAHGSDPNDLDQPAPIISFPSPATRYIDALPARGYRNALSIFYGAFFRPWVLIDRGVPESEIEEYGESVRLWERLRCEQDLDRIDRRAMSLFRDRLGPELERCEGEPPDPSLIEKHIDKIATILDVAGYADGRKGERTEWARKLLNEITMVPRPPTVPESVVVAHREHVLLFAEAAATAREPTAIGIEPAAFWRALIAVLYNTGIRIGAALRLEKSWIAEDESGKTWIRVHLGRWDDDRRLGALNPPLIYLNCEACKATKALDVAVAPDMDADLLVPWRHSPSFLTTIRAEILARSRIPAEARLVGFNGFRAPIFELMRRDCWIDHYPIHGQERLRAWTAMCDAIPPLGFEFK
jgi:integrase